jgi:hypothetical protein
VPYFVDLGLPTEAVVAQARLWFDVMSRQSQEMRLELIEVRLGGPGDEAASRMVTWS